jgi:acetate kinase
VGENSAPVRARALAGLEVLGIELDLDANAAPGRTARDVATPGSRVRVLVVPTNEELEIARQAAEVVSR